MKSFLPLMRLIILLCIYSYVPVIRFKTVLLFPAVQEVFGGWFLYGLSRTAERGGIYDCELKT